MENTINKLKAKGFFETRDDSLLVVGKTATGKSLLLAEIAKNFESHGIVLFANLNEFHLSDRKQKIINYDLEKSYMLLNFKLDGVDNTNLTLKNLINRVSAKTFIYDEIRGDEIETCHKAMETGHQGIYSIYGDSVTNGIKRYKNMLKHNYEDSEIIPFKYVILCERNEENEFSQKVYEINGNEFKEI